MSAQTGDIATRAAMRARAGEVYARHSRNAQEEKWILDNLPLVRHVVQKTVGQAGLGREQIEELCSAGTLGLVKAARAYDPARNAQFRTYAYIRIRGEVLDELRRESFVPSGVHGQIRRIQEVYHRLASEEGQPPDEPRLADELGISQAQLYRTLEEARRQNFLSIHGLSEEPSPLGAMLPTAPQSESPDAQAERREMFARLAKALKELPKRDRTVLLLYYERDLTMREAAAVLEVTESRFSQLHAGALFKLAMKLGAER
jgi:RNA polymerase sigma factor for flagellar operon FliA